MRARLALLALVLVTWPLASAAAGPWTRPEDRASRAALTATHGGRVKKVGRESEGGATWEVEVEKSRSLRLDVLLDSKFRVMNVSNEREPDEIPGRRKPGATATGQQATLAARAAARAVGGGVLIDVDRESDRGATWEVEFMKLDGRKVNVQLDDHYHVVRVLRGKKEY